jgi:4'-phosphopantetheinyl transferase
MSVAMEIGSRLPLGRELPAAALVEAEGDLHVWRIGLQADRAAMRHLKAILAPEEKARASGYRFESDARRFIVGRASLRRILGHYLLRNPAQIELVRGPWGKPELAGSGKARRVKFNASGSDDTGLVAVAIDREVGVDIESLRTMPELESIVERFFTASEKGAFRARSAEGRRDFFFRCWTRKEALAKAVGRGLTLPLERIETQAGIVGATPSVRIAGVPRARWRVRDLAPGAGFAAALAVGDARSLGRPRRRPMAGADADGDAFDWESIDGFLME